MIRWYVSRAGAVRGPFTELEVFALIANQQLQARDSTMVEGIEGWVPIEKTAPFMVSFGTSAHQATSAPVTPWWQHPAFLIASVFCCWPVELPLLWLAPKVPQWVKTTVTAVLVLGVAGEVAAIRSVFAGFR